jgi:two-component system LytT family response regulator
MQKVVFVTAYDQYAIRAFEVNALDYVMKPASQERLEQSLHRLRAHKQTVQIRLSSGEQTSVSPTSIPATKALSGMNEAGLLMTGEHLSGALLQEHDQLLLKFGSKSRFVLVKDVVFVRSADNYTEVHCSDGAIALMRRTLEEWAASLPGAVFVRIHRSALINIRMITETEQDAGGRLLIRLRGVEEQLTASRNFALGVKEALAR